jgi:hypothetical protein
MSIYIFHHIYCNNKTYDILRDQTNKIIFSGLYTAVDKIYCFLVGEENYIKLCKEYLGYLGQKIKIAEIGVNDTTYERFTLLNINKYIQPGDKFLYIHTKGVSHGAADSQTYYWRTFMEYYLMTQHERIIKDLDTYDVVGVKPRAAPKLHYSGNFWWATADYYLKLPDTIDDAYYAPEFYIGLMNPKMAVYADTQIHCGIDNIYPSIYLDV